MIDKILLLAVFLSFCGGIVIAKQYKEFVTFEMCARTQDHARDHEMFHIRKKSIHVVKPIKDRPDCAEILAPSGYRLRVYGEVPEVIRKLGLDE